MGDTKNLINTEAAAKIKDLAKEIDSCMFCTYKNGRLEGRPMSTRQVDDAGNVWFLSDKNSNKNKELSLNDNIELIYGQGHEKYMLLHGKASISYDRQKIKELWAPIAEVWCKGGAEDPNLSAIKITVSDGYYWDIKHNKMVEIAKLAVSLVSGKTMDDGIEGSLKTTAKA